MGRISRGLRNLNPGNIRRGNFRYKGECATSTDAEFRQFESIEWGYRAMFVVLHTYATKHHCHTIRTMVSRYAPRSENDTESYIRRVCRRTHLEADTPLDTLDGETMIKIVSAMSEVENGATATHRDVANGWQLFFDDFGSI